MIKQQFLEIRETDYFKHVMGEMERRLERYTRDLVNAKDWDEVIRLQSRIDELKLVQSTLFLE